MSLRRLCFVLPMDGDELLVASDDDVQRHPRQKLGSYVRGKVGRALSCLRGCGCHDSRSVTAGFEDMDGVYELGARKIKGASGPRVFSYSELYIGTSGFSADEVLGSGGFGRVYRAVLPSDGTTVAVKCVASVGVDRFDKSFLAELAAVARLRHRNLVRLRGWCVRDGEELLLVYDYMPNRSLDRLLFSPAAAPAAPLGWDRRRRIVAGLAAALLYLHEQLDTQIIHRDVKTSNVMLDSEYNARLGDFGLARWLEHAVEDAPPTKKLDLLPSTPSVRSTSSFSSSANYQFRLIDTSRIGGTIGYLPPESFQPRGGATAKSDVFSFGIVLLEVATGRRAVDLAYPDDQIFMLDWVRRLSDDGKLLNAGDRKLPQGGMFDMVRFIHLGLLCSMHDPRSRPTMKWVVENISGSSSGDLPPLPSFVAHPKYISLTSSSSDDSGTSTTIVGTNSTASPASSPMKPMYATAAGTTIYLTAEDGNKTSSGGGSGTDKSGNSQRSSLSPRPVVAVPNVDTPREISYKEIVAITNDFSESQVVAELDFGTGYEGFLDNGRGGRIHVLVKRLGMKTCPALRTRFANELCNLAKLRHRNLVQLRGWCTDHGEMLVVYDHSPGNLLSNHLLVRHSDSETLSWRHRYGIVRALASAVLYLHEEWDEQVIHRNITSAAVFLDPDRSPRLGSFALAEFLSRNEHSHHVVVPTVSGSARGIFGYMSPEYMESGEATTMADVYSFGVVVLEVVTGAMAVDVRSPEVLLVRKVQLCQEQDRDVEALADRRLDDMFDRQELVRLAKIGIACTRSDPAARPSMRKIVSILDGNDEVLRKFERRTESRVEWERKNATALSLVRRLQALGIH
ncbi:receptor like protein kinase S.2 [Lolium perenne]|uniref:receptor like protein kinase S.2 n=1 Tax=Lolium perenne TaxID=4522 RepID=UPI0021EAD7B2|nr:receptor like protein kinase S.2 [Lolium perenne]